MPLDRRQAIFLESLRRFLRRSALVNLRKLLTKVRPQDFPPLYEDLTEREQLQLFQFLADKDPELGASLLVELREGQGPALLRRLGPDRAARLLEQCADDDAADLLADLEEEFSAEILERMKPEEKAAVEQLLIYEEETAGRIMTPDVLALPETMTVEEAIRTIQERGRVEMAFYLYVVDQRHHLVGVLSLRELLLHPPTVRLHEIMNTDLVTVRTDTDQEEVARVAAKYDLLAIPVVDEQGRLAGVVTIDDVIDVLREEATEDFYRLAGTSEEERIEPSVIKSARIRSPWLLAVFVGDLLAGVVIGSFKGTLEHMVGLAAFVPIVLAMGGTTGNQSAIVIIRGLATGRVKEGEYVRTLLRELGTAGLLGFLYGVLLFGASVGMLWWRGLAPDPRAAVLTGATIGVALALSMMFATVMGASMPLLLHRLGFDPAVSTTPFVTTSTDAVGSLIFFLLATWVLLPMVR